MTSFRIQQKLCNTFLLAKELFSFHVKITSEGHIASKLGRVFPAAQVSSSCILYFLIWNIYYTFSSFLLLLSKPATHKLCPKSSRLLRTAARKEEWVSWISSWRKRMEKERETICLDQAVYMKLWPCVRMEFSKEFLSKESYLKGSESPPLNSWFTLKNKCLA